MLRNLLIITSSGVVVFSKEFFNPISQPRMVGSLIVAMLEFSSQNTGLQLSYIELTNVGITIVASDNAKIFCMLFHDKADGEAFGKLLATEILLEFLCDYSVDTITASRNLNEFHEFHFKLSSVIKNAMKPVLVELQKNRGVLCAVLVLDNDSGNAESMISSSTDVDQVGLLANINALTSAAKSLVDLHNPDDTMSEIWIESVPNRSCRLVVQRVEKATILVQCSKRYDKGIYNTEIANAVSILRKVLVLGGKITKAN